LRVRGWAVLAVLMLALSACRGPVDPTQQAIATAEVHSAAGNTTAAVATLAAAISEQGESFAFRLAMARVLLAGSDFPGAVAELDKAIAIGGDDNLTVPLLAEALVRGGRSRRLIEEFASVKLSQPSAQSLLLARMAEAHAAQRDLPQARAAADAALALDPKNLRARLILARFAAYGGDVDSALRQLQALEKEAPREADIPALRAELLEDGKRDFAGASAAYDAALRLSPKHLNAHIGAVQMALARQDLPGARERLNQMILALSRHPTTWYLETQFALLQGDLPRARELVTQMIKSAPNHPGFLTLAGLVEFKAGSLTAAETHLSKALSRADKGDGTRLLLAQVQIAQGDIQAALDNLGPLLAQPQPTSRVLATAAEAHQAAGRHAQAEQYFERAAAAAPGDARLRAALALQRVEGGEEAAVQRGLSDLEDMARLQPSAYADAALVNARLRARDYEGALAALAQAEKKAPTSAALPMVRGAIALQRRDNAAALAAFEQALKLSPGYLPALLALTEIDLRDNQPARSLARFNAALARDPRDHRLRLAKAELMRAQGARTLDVLSEIEEAVRRSPAEAAPRAALIRHHLGANNPRQALVGAYAALAALPDNAAVLDVVAQAQMAAGEPAQALIALRKLVSKLPGDPAPQVRLADALLAVGDTDGARDHLKQVLAVAPNLPQAHYGLLRIAISERRWREATEIARGQQARLPDRPEGYEWEGDTLLAQRQWLPAAAAYRRALQRGQKLDAELKLHSALSSGGKRAEADALVAKWQAKPNVPPRVLLYLGDRAAASSDFAGAQKLYQRAADAAPTNPIAWNNVAWAMVKQGLPGASKVAAKADELSPENPLVMDTLAQALALDSDLNRALEVQQKAVLLAPTRHELRLTLARLALRAGDRATARVELVRLETLGRAFAEHAEVSALLQQMQ
jgi:cellulose synthase operon protein C